MDVEKEVRGLWERVALAEQRADVAEVLCVALISYLAAADRAHLRARRDAMRRRLDAERPMAGHAFADDRLAALNLLDQLLLEGLDAGRDEPLDIGG